MKSTLDKIFIKDLRLPFVIGCEKWERQKKTDVFINVTLWVSSEQVVKAAKTTNLADALDYRIVYNEILTWSQEKEYILIETLAQDIADFCLQLSLVQKIQVSVAKPHILPHSQSAGIEITREKQ